MANGYMESIHSWLGKWEEKVGTGKCSAYTTESLSNSMSETCSRADSRGSIACYKSFW